MCSSPSHCLEFKPKPNCPCSCSHVTTLTTFQHPFLTTTWSWWVQIITWHCQLTSHLSKVFFAIARNFTSPTWPTTWATTSRNHSSCNSDKWDGGQQPSIGMVEMKELREALSWGFKHALCNCAIEFIKIVTRSAKRMDYHHYHLHMLNNKSNLMIWSSLVNLFCLNHE